ncbi:isoamyl acetate-hydrolyzing esterase 1 homolog isoform X3 [Rhincodon typus]|uniref:isoamyl acetate-hydrolyzing esterase 1 homolog isoform X3 n=1 Tax=Rhincodon typus TaxID=259920 RepID=UPI00202EE8F8|nr:isoamyl acetate-hydrolyzing esterase 1 homolog isoform X3 [Rhincodon typus]
MQPGPVGSGESFPGEGERPSARPGPGHVGPKAPVAQSDLIRRLHHSDINPAQHIPITEYAENLKRIVQYLKSIDICEDKVIMITPSPLDESAWEKECIAKGSKLNRYNSVTNQYAGVCVKVAKECGTDVLDLCTLMQMKNQDFSSYLSDGLHLSEKGNKFLETHLWTLLEKKTERLPMILPHWSNIDHLNPEASLLV